MSTAKGFVVPAGGGKSFRIVDARPLSPLKLLGRETKGSIMMFEETVPAGTKSTLHLHHDSDEVAWVLEGKITFMIGDRHGRRTGHLRVHAARRPTRLEEHRRRDRPGAVPLHAGLGR